MSWFHKGNKVDDQNVAKTSTQPANPHHSAGKLHTRRKKKNLLDRMKIMESVPATVIDAIHHDASVINSDNDFVRSDPLKFSDGTYYPVFIFDEASMEDAGFGDKKNKDALGQLSVGLKTSSGSTGFVPVATSESLGQGFMGILPMHDAFEVLRDYPVVENYQNGWLVGLLRIDNDELSLSKSTVRLSMPEWWEYVNKKMDLIVDNDQLCKSTDVPTDADPLATDSEEEAGGSVPNHLAESQALPTGQFDDDDGPASNSNIDDFVHSQDGSTVDSGNDQDGYAIPGLDTGGDNQDNDNDELPQDSDEVINSGNGADIPMTMPDDHQSDDQGSQADDGADIPTGIPTSDSYTQLDSNSADTQMSSASMDDDVQTSGGIDNQVPAASQPVSQPQYEQSTSRDDLEARNVLLSSSIRTLQDLQVSISDVDFVNTYLNPLTVEMIPLLDESNDPTGRIHHQNELIKHANQELKGALQDQKSSLRSWFENQRAGILSALQQRSETSDTNLNKAWQSLIDLQDELADDNKLKDEVRIDLQDELEQMDQRFDRAHVDARNAAVAEVERQFNDRREKLEQRKQDAITNGVANRKQEIALKAANAKNKLRDIAKTAASQAYQTMMDQGSDEYKLAQKRLVRRRQLILDKLDADSNHARAEENRRIANQAEIVKHDTQIDQLKAQIKQMQERHQDDLNTVKANAEMQIKTIQGQATSAQQDAVAKVQDDLDKTVAEKERLQSKLDQMQDKMDAKLEAKDEDADRRVAAVEAKHADDQAKFERTNRHFTRYMLAGIAGTAIVFGGAGYLGGALQAANSQPRQTQQQAPANNTQDTQRPMIIQVPGNSNNSNSNNSSSSKSSESHKTNSDTTSESSSMNNNSSQAR